MYATEMCAILNPWGTREPRRLTLPFGGANPPDERKEGDMMYITYSDLIQTVLLLMTLVGLCFTIFKERK